MDMDIDYEARSFRKARWLNTPACYCRLAYNMTAFATAMLWLGLGPGLIVRGVTPRDSSVRARAWIVLTFSLAYASFQTAFMAPFHRWFNETHPRYRLGTAWHVAFFFLSLYGMARLAIDDVPEQKPLRDAYRGMFLSQEALERGDALPRCVLILPLLYYSMATLGWKVLVMAVAYGGSTRRHWADWPILLLPETPLLLAFGLVWFLGLFEYVQSAGHVLGWAWMRIHPGTTRVSLADHFDL